MGKVIEFKNKKKIKDDRDVNNIIVEAFTFLKRKADQERTM
ncbi:hypothetical protein [Shouchella patagoniensis]|nr:hypothetical protein [Shouchella patagoniensis]